MSKKISKQMKIPIYHVNIIFSNSAKQLDKLYPGCNLDKRGCGGFVTTVQEKTTGDYKVVMCINDTDDRVVVHESVHAAWAVLDIIGTTSDRDNQEPLAYLTDFIFFEAKRALKL